MPYYLMYIPGPSDPVRVVNSINGAGLIGTAETISALFDSDSVQFQMESEVIEDCRKRHASKEADKEFGVPSILGGLKAYVAGRVSDSFSATILPLAVPIRSDEPQIANDFDGPDQSYCVGTQ